MKKAIFGIVFLVGGCASSAAYQRLSGQERDDFASCREYIARNKCGSDSHTAAGTGSIAVAAMWSQCVNEELSKYADADDKHRFLLRAGCPRDVVSP